MAYRIEINLIDEAKVTHAMSIYSMLMEEMAKIGLSNFKGTELYDKDKFTTLASLQVDGSVPKALHQEANDTIQARVNSLFGQNDTHETTQ